MTAACANISSSTSPAPTSTVSARSPTPPTSTPPPARNRPSTPASSGRIQKSEVGRQAARAMAFTHCSARVLWYLTSESPLLEALQHVDRVHAEGVDGVAAFHHEQSGQVAARDLLAH